MRSDRRDDHIVLAIAIVSCLDHGDFTYHDRTFYRSASEQSIYHHKNVDNRNLSTPYTPFHLTMSADWNKQDRNSHRYDAVSTQTKHHRLITKFSTGTQILQDHHHTGYRNGINKPPDTISGRLGKQTSVIHFFCRQNRYTSYPTRKSEKYPFF